MPGLSYLPRFLYSQWFITPKYPHHRFDGQTVIVTGANQGLGFEAAKHIIRNGAAKVILAVRSLEKGEAAKHDIEQNLSNVGVVEVWQLDLSSYDSVKSFAVRVERDLDRVDVLVENAGISAVKFARNEGQESTITVNVISTILLGLLLLPKLRKSARKFDITPRLVFVSSEVHHFSDMPERKHLSGSIFTAFADDETFSAGLRYWTSKLALILALQRLIEEQCNNEGENPVIITHVNPGFCRSALMRDVGWGVRLAELIFHARSTEVGSRTLVYAAAAGAESHGQYLSDCEVAPLASFVDSPDGKDVGDRLWKELKQILETIQPGIFTSM